MLSQALGYGAILFPACIVLWLVNTLSAALRGTGNMQLPARVMLLSAAVQVPLSGVLIMGAFGLPALGLAGAAVSVVSVAAVNSLFLLAWLRYRDRALRLRRDRFQLRRSAFRDIGRVALPALLSPLFTVLTIVSLTALVGRQGVDALAGYGIGSRIEFLLVPLVFGIGAALTAMVGTNMGAGQVTRAEHIGWLGAGAAGVLTGAVGLLLALFPDSWVGLFTDHPPTLAAGVAYMTYVGPAFGFLGVGLALYFASPGGGARGMACYCDAPTFSRCRWGRCGGPEPFRPGFERNLPGCGFGDGDLRVPERGFSGAWCLATQGWQEFLRRLGAPEPGTARARSTRLRRQEAIGEALGPKAGGSRPLGLPDRSACQQEIGR